MIKVGICGFSTSKKKIYEELKLLEIQKTFYDPGRIETYKKWREEAPKDFEFTVKAWQGLTHDIRSPTWKRFKGELPGNPENYGGLRLNDETRYALRKTLEVCQAVGASKIVVQLPPKLMWMDYMYETLEYISGLGYVICLEPRNRTWFDDEVIETLKGFGIVFVTDPFKDGIVDIHDSIIYLRLHGIGGYKYRYSDDDLKRLYDMVARYQDKDVYILFNNVYMYQDAVRFIELLNST